MRLDAHIHLFEHGFSADRPAGAELAEYENYRAQYGIKRALVVGYEGDPQFAGNNDYLLGLAANLDWVVALYFLDPTRATAAEVHSAVARGASGFSFYLGADPEIVDTFDPEVWVALASHRLPISVNATPEAMPSLSRIVSALPDTPVLIGHIGLPGIAGTQTETPLARMMPLCELAAHHTVTVKLSALYATDPTYPHIDAQDHVRILLDIFGPERIVWGSDFAPGLDVVHADELFAIPDWITDQLPDEHLHRVLATNLNSIITTVKER